MKENLMSKNLRKINQKRKRNLAKKSLFTIGALLGMTAGAAIPLVLGEVQGAKREKLVAEQQKRIHAFIEKLKKQYADKKGNYDPTHATPAHTKEMTKALNYKTALAKEAKRLKDERILKQQEQVEIAKLQRQAKINATKEEKEIKKANKDRDIADAQTEFDALQKKGSIATPILPPAIAPTTSTSPDVMATSPTTPLNTYTGAFYSGPHRDKFLACTTEAGGFSMDELLTGINMPQVIHVALDGFNIAKLTTIVLPKVETIGNQAFVSSTVSTINFPYLKTLG